LAQATMKANQYRCSVALPKVPDLYSGCSGHQLVQATMKANQCRCSVAHLKVLDLRSGCSGHQLGRAGMNLVVHLMVQGNLMESMYRRCSVSYLEGMAGHLKPDSDWAPASRRQPCHLELDFRNRQGKSKCD
jgi:hypothetical protein